MNKLMAWMLAFGMAVGSAQALQIGGGAQYFKTIDDIGGDFEDNGLAPVVSIKGYLAEYLALQGDVELRDSGYAGALKDVTIPKVFLLLGKGLYGGLGAGWLYSDGDISDSPFFILRAGLQTELVSGLFLDINANYEFAEWDGINEIDENVDSDTVTLGAALRIEF